MSQTNPEANDLAAAFGSAAGSAARMALSNEFAAGVIGQAASDIIKNLKNGDSSPAPSDSKKPSNSGTPSDSAPAPTETPNQQHKHGTGGLLSDLLGSPKRTQPNDKPGDRSGIIKDLEDKIKPNIENMFEKGGMSIESFFRKVTDEDRKEAKEKLAKGIDPVIKGEDRKILEAAQAAIIDGKADDLAKALKPLAGKPELANFVKSLNSQLGASNSVELATDSKGNVLVYDKGGNTAVSINPATGATELRPIERQADGSIVVKPGEIINRTVAEVMKSAGDEATRSVVHPYRFKHFGELDSRPFIIPDGLKNHSRSGSGGGGGGGDGSGPSSLPDKLLTPSKPKPGDSK